MASSLQNLLERARPFLRGELESIDENLPRLVRVLQSVSAGECWHKHGSFLHHLLDVYRILSLWKAPHAVSLCGLFHSAYSNSYVNLAIFDPSTGREVVREHVSLSNAKEKGMFDMGERWRKKLQDLVPAEGVKVKHIRTGEEVRVSRRVVAVFLMMTMADFCDQLFGFQDELFDNANGRLEFSGNNFGALWPGDGKPGLWLSSISRMGAVYSLIAREEEIFIQEKRSAGGLGKVEELLVGSISKNPFVGEPYVVLSQVYLTEGRLVLLMKAKEKSWPHTSWGILNLGLVK
uniref:DUF6817 domain-containing protein n=1 Tax=Cajanus cajan TaxID=3821 RepID=A0A151RVK5_CAJCA|nr:hypothetical protein KK1_031838 [Cajanus cajan]